MKSLAFMTLLIVVCASCRTVETDRTLCAELRALPDHSLVKFERPMSAHDGGSTTVPLGFNNGQEYMLRCFCQGNLLIGLWNTNEWEKGYRFQIRRSEQDKPVETIRLDSPVAKRLSLLLQQFVEATPSTNWTANFAASLSKMMHRETYEAAKASAGFMNW